MSFVDGFRALPKAPVISPSSANIQVSLLIPARAAAHSLETTVEEAHRHFAKRFGGEFEIILIPNSRAGTVDELSAQITERLGRRFPEVRVVPHDSPAGKGAALRTGFVASRGQWVFFTDADLPYDLEFFDRAAERLQTGVDLVTGNRRMPESYFDIPVSLLRLAYGRHRLGLWFNRLVRILLPIPTTDTQAGIKAMSRRFASQSFSVQSCPGFFFDLEFFLTARGSGFRQEELPVTLYLNSEKSTVRVFQEGILALFWLVRITLRNARGAYRRQF